MTLLAPWDPVAENYRLLRANLDYGRTATQIKVLLVTSPGPEEGKTVTAANFAITIAQSGRQTLLIEADLRRPSQHKLLGANLQPGLADILAEKSVNPSRLTTSLYLLPA